MSTVSIQITGDVADVERLLADFATKPAAKPEPRWTPETPWFERYGKLTPDEAADLEASTYGSSQEANFRRLENRIDRFAKALERAQGYGAGGFVVLARSVAARR